MTGFVYFIHAPEVARVKIGFATNVASRVNKIRSDSPVPVLLIGQMPGTLADEANMHRRFEAFRINREWFSASPQVMREAARYPVLSPIEAQEEPTLASRVIEKFGGRRAFAEVLGITVVSAYRMTYPRERGGTGGTIPQKHHAKLFKAAQEKGIELCADDLIESVVPASPKQARKRATPKVAA